jgi:hypothetical protein
LTKEAEHTLFDQLDFKKYLVGFYNLIDMELFFFRSAQRIP